MKITNQDLIQSYIITSARYDFSVHEKRILYAIIQMFQFITTNKKLNEKYSVQKDLFGDYAIEIPVQSCLKSEDDKNHTKVKDALRALENKKFEYEDDKTWQLIRLIQSPEINKRSDTFRFRLHHRIVDAMHDFSKGYSKYEFLTAMEFESVYAMRFYELLSNQKKPIDYNIDTLKMMFKIEGKYKNNGDFKRDVIDIAKKELDSKSPFSFKYKERKQGRKIIGFTFYPILIPKNKDPELEQKRLQKETSLGWDLDRVNVLYLRENFAFSDEEIKNNLSLFKLAQKKLDLIYKLSTLRNGAEKAKNPKGFVINALKNMLSQA